MYATDPHEDSDGGGFTDGERCQPKRKGGRMYSQNNEIVSHRGVEIAFLIGFLWSKNHQPRAISYILGIIRESSSIPINISFCFENIAISPSFSNKVAMVLSSLIPSR
jgi:hypothetical protein